MLHKYDLDVLARDYGLIGRRAGKSSMMVGFDVLSLSRGKNCIELSPEVLRKVEGITDRDHKYLWAVSLEKINDKRTVAAVVPEFMVEGDLRCLPGRRREVLQEEKHLIYSLGKGERKAPTVYSNSKCTPITDPWLKAAVIHRIMTETLTSELREAIDRATLVGFRNIWEHVHNGYGLPKFKRLADEVAVQVLLPHLRAGTDCFGPFFDLGGKDWCSEKILDLVLAVDIEVDGGGQIREIGLADYNGASWKLEPDFSNPHEIAAVRVLLTDLAMSRPIIVGHNLWYHDLPKLREQLNVRLDEFGLVWDTLWMSSLLSPEKRSHALVNPENAHDSVSDALKTIELFREQWKVLPADRIGCLFDIWEKGDRGIEASLAALERSDCHGNHSEVRVFAPKDEMVPARELSQRLWKRPNRLNSAFAPGLPEGGGQIIRPGSLSGTNAASGQAANAGTAQGQYRSIDPLVRRPEYRFLAMLARRAELSGLHLYREMVPRWIRDAPGCKDILDRVGDFEAGESETPGIMSIDFAVQALMTGRLDRIDPALIDDEVYLRSITEQGPFPQESASELTEKYGVRPLEASSLPDQPQPQVEYGVLTRPWRRIYGRDTGSVIARLVVPAGSRVGTAQKGLVTVPKWLGGLGWDDDAALWPTTTSRYNYWGTILNWVSSLAAKMQDSLLLVGVPDPCELELVEELASEPEYRLTIPDPERFRLRRMESVLKSDFPALFVRQDQMRDWLEAAKNLQISGGRTVQPVILHVPHELWGGWDAADTTKPRAKQEETRKILGRFMKIWIQEILGCRDGVPKPVCLDYRLPLMIGRSDAMLQRTAIQLLAETASQKEVRTQYRSRFGAIDHGPPPTDVEEYRNFLKKRWGYDDFRESQKPGLEAIVTSDRDVLVTLPTGEGKSVLFQVPALLRTRYTGRLSVIVTPLRALMEDQVRSLKDLKFHESVDYITADRDPFTLSYVYQGVGDGTIRLLYVAPERFQSRRFQRVIRERIRRDGGLDFLIFDEAHCLSEWGFQFRPDYLRAMRYINEKLRGEESGGARTRLLLFSATVTRLVQEELKKIVLGGAATDTSGGLLAVPEEPQWPLQPFIDVEPINGREAFGEDGNPEERGEQVKAILEDIRLKNDVSSSIVFVSRRKDAEMLGNMLRTPGVEDSRSYHAGLSRMDRKQIYEDFRNRKISKLAATCAFGMGMDVPHIHRCVHFTPPKTLESLVQEIGRMGRDEKHRRAAKLDRLAGYILHSPGDFEWLNQRMERSRLSGDDLKTVWKAVKEQSQPLGDSWVAFLPVDWSLNGDEAVFNADKTGMALFWLEECGRCRIESILPSVIELEISTERLKQEAKGKSQTARVAKALLGAESESKRIRKTVTEKQPEDKRRGGFLGAIIESVVGFFFGTPTKKETTTTESSPQRKPTEEVSKQGHVFLPKIMEEAGLQSLDEVLKSIRDLDIRHAVMIKRELTFDKVRVKENANDVLNRVQELAERLLGKRKWSERLLQNTFYPMEGAGGSEDNLGKVDDDPIRQKKRRELNVVLSLMTGLGIFRESAASRGEIAFQRTTRYGKAQKRIIREVVSFTSAIRDKVVEAGGSKCSVNLSEILTIAGDKPKVGIIRAGLRLLDDLRIACCRQELIPMTYVITINDMSELRLPHEPEQKDGQDGDDVLKRLGLVQEMSELRCAAVEVMLNIDEDEMRREFISGYFRARDEQSLTDCIEEALKQIPSGRPLVCRIAEAGQSRLRARRNELMDELLNTLRPPSKREAVQMPSDRNLLVNAGPGSGKTYLLEARVVYHVHGSLRPEQIMLLAFNRAVISEIKTRVRLRFKTLGYGEYGRRVQCYTFHGLAERFLRQIPDGDPQMSTAEAAVGSQEPDAKFDRRLETFVKLCEEKISFVKRIMNGVRMLLVDEYQDMDDIKYRLLKVLSRDAGVAVTVVGDDDQDIVGFTRKNDEIKEGVEYFRLLRGELPNVQESVLDLNMRSVPEIVERANAHITRMLGHDRTKHMTILKAERDPSPDSVLRCDGAMSAPDVAEQIERISRQDDAKTVAVLCRTNDDAFWLSEELAKLCPSRPPWTIAGTSRLRLMQTRGWAELLAQLTDCCGGDTKCRIEDIKVELSRRFSALPIPEAAASGKMITELLDIAGRERGYLRVRDVEELLCQLSITDFIWLGLRKGADAVQPTVIVTTVHRVKGLEFDGVILPPSRAPFPLSSSESLELERREEARVFYVGITRARTYLVVGFDQRERRWLGNSVLRRWGGERTQAKWAEGGPSEIYLNRSGESPECRRYIRERVAIGDEVDLVSSNGRFNIIHRGMCLGQTSSKLRPAGRSPLRQSGCRIVAVYKYHPQDDWLKKIKACDPDYPGWHYVPLIQGRIESS